MPKTITFFLLLFLSIGIFAQPEYNMQNATVTDCSGILYDSGGPDGDYSSDEDFTFTICPEPTPTCIELDFGTVDTEDFFERLEIYDGVGTAQPLLSYHNNGLQTIPIIKAYSGCVTVRFQSDATGEESGWKATWTCFEEDCPPKIALPNEQDCEGAIVVCQEIYNNDSAYVGEGNVLDEINPNKSCFESGERNSVWYKLRIAEDGELAFSIVPDDLFDDYDWAVFDITNASCGQISEDASLAVSCNYSIQPGITGATGATNQVQGASSDGNQNATIPVKNGEIYMLNVSQFTSQGKYTIDFSASTTPIGQEIEPAIGEIKDFLKGTDSETLQINFLEDLQCVSIAEDMTVSIEGHELANKTVCNELDYSSTFLYHIEPALTFGSHTLKLEGTIRNVCGTLQLWENDIDFIVEDVTNIDDALKSKIRLYPNPSNETIFIELPEIGSEKAQVELYNMEGKQLQSTLILNQKNVEIEVSGYPKGIYWLKIKVGERVWTEKVVVQ